MLPLLRSELSDLSHDLLELLAPDRCAVCDAVLHRPALPGFCDACLDRIPLLDPAACGACGAPLSPGASCPACAAKRRPWDGMLVATEHAGVIRDLLRRWKYHPDAVLSRPLSGLLISSLGDAMPLAEEPLVVPVPQHDTGWRHRGFHPAGDLAGAVARHTGARRATPLRRGRRGRPQVGLTAAQRRRNVDRLFRVPPRAGARLAGRPVLLVDDVVTTTATATACAAALRGAGCSRIVVIALARATV